MGFLNDLYKKQFGFQILISLIESIEKAIDNKSFCLWSLS